MDYLVALSLVGIGVGTVRYVLYFRDIFRGTVKPHVFSWFVWGLLTGIVSVAQIVAGGGPGAWITVYITLMCLTISAVAYFKGTTDITRFDWICFIAALLAIAVWALTSTPLYALFIAMAADLLGYLPTYRKSIKNPDEESALGFGLASLRSVFGIAALAAFNPTTLLYPVFLLVADAVAALIVVIRRIQLGRPHIWR